MVKGRIPTVPEYYREFINSSVDLIDNPKQCCPFHQENTPSFSYDVRTGRWSCFGKCHAHGDVFDMHQRWFHFGTREEAEQDLYTKCNVPRKTLFDVFTTEKENHYISQSEVDDNVLYSKAISLANTPERWLQLDYVMSKSPLESYELQELINEWTGFKSLLE